MPAVEIDVENIPDIIEAQLTLSYSRLSDLIRVIVEQGNGHEDDIAQMRAQLDKLTRENAALRDEVNTLKSAGSKEADVSGVEAQLRVLQQAVADHDTAHEAARSKQQTDNAAREAAEKALQNAARTNADSMTALESALTSALTRLAAVEQDSSLPKAFTDLWGGRPELIFAMASRDETNPSEFEHSVEERTAFLHSLPPFVAMHNELDVLNKMINKQAAEAIQTAARSHRSSSAAALSNSGRGAEIDELAEAVHRLEQRLTMMEARAEADHRQHHTQAAPDLYEGAARWGEEVAALQERLTQLEESLQMFCAKPREGGDASGSGAANADVALMDLHFRVKDLERTVEGRCVGAEHSPSAAVAPAVHVNHYRNAYEGTEAGGEVSRRTASSSLSHSQVHLDSTAKDSMRPGSAGRAAAQSPRPPSGRSASLPPLAASATSTLLQASGGAAVERVAAAAPAGARSISQPTVECLRRGLDGSASAIAPARRISVAVEQDDGLRRRVAQLEENTAILEVNKADRRELRLLEEAIRNFQQQQQRIVATARGPSVGSGGQPLAPHRPMSGSACGGGMTSNPTDVYADGGAANGAMSRPQTASSAMGYAGRPLFVSGGSGVNLRDGAQLTSATISTTYQASR